MPRFADIVRTDLVQLLLGSIVNTLVNYGQTHIDICKFPLIDSGGCG